MEEGFSMNTEVPVERTQTHLLWIRNIRLRTLAFCYIVVLGTMLCLCFFRYCNFLSVPGKWESYSRRLVFYKSQYIELNAFLKCYVRFSKIPAYLLTWLQTLFVKRTTQWPGAMLFPTKKPSQLNSWATTSEANNCTTLWGLQKLNRTQT